MTTKHKRSPQTKIPKNNRKGKGEGNQWHSTNTVLPTAIDAVGKVTNASGVASLPEPLTQSLAKVCPYLPIGCDAEVHPPQYNNPPPKYKPNKHRTPQSKQPMFQSTRISPFQRPSGSPVHSFPQRGYTHSIVPPDDIGPVRCCYEMQEERGCLQGANCCHCHWSVYEPIYKKGQNNNGKEDKKVKNGIEPECPTMVQLFPHLLLWRMYFPEDESKNTGNVDIEEKQLLYLFKSLPCQYGMNCKDMEHRANALKANFTSKKKSMYNDFVEYMKYIYKEHEIKYNRQLSQKVVHPIVKQEESLSHPLEHQRTPHTPYRDNIEPHSLRSSPRSLSLGALDYYCSTASYSPPPYEWGRTPSTDNNDEKDYHDDNNDYDHLQCDTEQCSALANEASLISQLPFTNNNNIINNIPIFPSDIIDFPSPIFPLTESKLQHKYPGVHWIRFPELFDDNNTTGNTNTTTNTNTNTNTTEGSKGNSISSPMSGVFSSSTSSRDTLITNRIKLVSNGGNEVSVGLYRHNPYIGIF